jgi:hypothetical protein
MAEQQELATGRKSLDQSENQQIPRSVTELLIRAIDASIERQLRGRTQPPAETLTNDKPN